MSTLHKRGRLGRSLAASVALVGASLALLPAPSAQATVTGVVTGGTASWGLSTYLGSANPGRPNPYPAGFVAPATFDTTTRIAAWAAATGTIGSDGAATLAFDGAAVNYTATSGSWMKLEDPQVALDTSGNGTVTALVSYGLGTGGTPGNVPYDPAAVVRASQRVDVVNLTGNTAGDRTTTPATVTWVGLDGAWDPDFIDFLDGDTTPEPDIAPWPYAVTFTGAADRLALPFTFTVNRAVPTVNVTTTATNPTTGLTLNVTGDGFTGVTNPGDAGVYVGLAPAGGLPDVSSQAGMASFAAAAYIPAAAMTSGAISASLTAAPSKLDPTKSYAVYTWQAHTHSNTTQDTVTPVTINWTALKAVSSVTATWKKVPTTANKKGKVAVSVSGGTAAPTGVATLTLARKGSSKTKTVTGTLVNGAVVIKLPKLKKGRWTVTVAYAGDSTHQASGATLKVKVKARPKK